MIRPAFRWLAFTASAVAVALALWAGGIDALQWSGWFQKAKPTEHKMTNAAPRTAPAARPPATSIPASGLLPGTRSSVSAVPQELVLTGVAMGRSVKDGYAMLGVARENPQTYAAGALLANGARLAEIHSNYVVLEKAGRSARLYLEGSGLTGAASTTGSLLNVGGFSSRKPATVTSTELLTDYLRPTPRYDGTSLVGYEIYPGAKSGAFTQLGFQPGDVITQIDGAPLSDSVQATESLRTLMDGGTHAASVLRKGSIVEVSLDSSFVAKDMEQERAAASAAPVTVPGS